MSESSKITFVEGTGLPLRGNDIDTDRIIPARFLKALTFDELKGKAFFDERLQINDGVKAHPLDDEKYLGSTILIVNKNFGCGSSREHAPQALLRHGIRAIVGESFGEIFAGNCTAIGIVAVTLKDHELSKLQSFVEQNPQSRIRIHVNDRTIIYNNETSGVVLPDTNHYLLTQGKWDSTMTLLTNKLRIRETALNIPYLQFNDHSKK